MWPSFAARATDSAPTMPFAPAANPDKTRTRTLFQRQFRVAEYLQHRSEHFAACHFRDRFVIGLHFRATDKGTEAPPVAPATALAALASAVEAATRLHRLRPVVFLATDSASFLRDVSGALTGADLVSLDGVQRSDGQTGIHNLQEKDGRAAAQAAMLDAVLLSRANLLIKTASALSAWSALLARPMPVVMLNHTFTHTQFFPDSILQGTAFAPDRIDDAVGAAVMQS